MLTGEPPCEPLSFVLLAAALIPAAASAQTSKPVSTPQCFFDRDWRGWKAIDDKSMYIRVDINHFYRVDFSSGCPEMREPNARLITHSTSGSVCNALDLDIKVRQPGGFSTSCIASKLTQLTPAEAAAIPKKQLP